MKIVDIVYWILNVAILWSLIYGFVIRSKTKKLLKLLEDVSKRRDENFEAFVITHTERLTLLAKENDKLREENDMMKERLTNLGLHNE